MQEEATNDMKWQMEKQMTAQDGQGNKAVT